jgi:hypothetical protein
MVARPAQPDVDVRSLTPTVLRLLPRYRAERIEPPIDTVPCNDHLLG